MFEEVYPKWLDQQIAKEITPRRRELLRKGLSWEIGRIFAQDLVSDHRQL